MSESLPPWTSRAPRGWSRAAQRRSGRTHTEPQPCWSCGVIGCTECGPNPDAPDERESFAVADDDYADE